MGYRLGVSRGGGAQYRFIFVQHSGLTVLTSSVPEAGRFWIPVYVDVTIGTSATLCQMENVTILRHIGGGLTILVSSSSAIVNDCATSA